MYKIGANYLEVKPSDKVTPLVNYDKIGIKWTKNKIYIVNKDGYLTDDYGLTGYYGDDINWKHVEKEPEMVKYGEWKIWNGGENPVPGKKVQIQFAHSANETLMELEKEYFESDGIGWIGMETFWFKWGYHRLSRSD